MICEESQTSTYNQPLDNAVMASVDLIYRQNYDAGITANLRARRAAIDNFDRFSYLVKTVVEVNGMRYK